MKFKIIFTSLLFFGLVFSSQSSFAQSTLRVGKRQVKQQVRIKQGVRSGELTRKETKALRAQQRHINRTKKRAKADGVVTPAERKVISRKQNRASKSIRRQKNDAQSRN
ncbi:MAG: hypothetical protein AAFR87_29260 [Bacteroidota bacterium]